MVYWGHSHSFPAEFAPASCAKPSGPGVAWDAFGLQTLPEDPRSTGLQAASSCFPKAGTGRAKRCSGTLREANERSQGRSIPHKRAGESLIRASTFRVSRSLGSQKSRGVAVLPGERGGYRSWHPAGELPWEGLGWSLGCAFTFARKFPGSVERWGPSDFRWLPFDAISAWRSLCGRTGLRSLQRKRLGCLLAVGCVGVFLRGRKSL